ncbi:MAG: hypothetical protein Q3988_05740 [Gemella sp.]|nr:hypothetical protein [Gemella sp.]
MNLKKVLPLILTSSLIFVTACSNQAEHKTLIDKSLNFLKHNNSYEIISEETSEKNKQNVKNTYTFSNKSFVYRQISENPDYKTEQYIKDGISYVKNAKGEWYRDNNDRQFIEHIEDLKILSTLDKKDVTIQEDDSTYTLNFKPVDMESFEKTIFANTPQIIFEKTKIEEYWATLKIDKKTMKPTHFENKIKADVHSKLLDENNKEIEFSFINDSTKKSDFKFDSIPTVELPKEAESAKKI